MKRGFTLLTALLPAGALLLGATTPKAARLQSGPMVGYSEPKEVLLWAQTNAPARVQFAYWDEAKPELKHRTAEKATVKEEGYVAKLIADEVEPGKRYAYELLIDGEVVPRPYALRFQTRPAMRFRNEPPPLRFALGSCYYANDPEDPLGWNPGAEYGIFGAILEKQPDFMLWLGDNVYTREQDWTSRTGLIARYTYTRSVKELQPLLGSVHHYALWDDHDYGPNDSDRSFRDKKLSRDIFKLFWGNQAYGVDVSPGVTTRFVWNDIELLLLDDRWNRTPDMRRTGKRQILGDAQIDWLIDALASSNATFKLVVMGGQILNPARVAETYANFPEEQAELLKRISNEGVRGVVFVTGDRHFTELSKLERPGKYPFYDFTVSPLTVSPSNGENEANTLLVPGTYVNERNFGTIDVGGAWGDRSLTLSVFGTRGQPLWSRVIKQRELRDPEE